MINNDILIKTKKNLIKINIAVVGSFLIIFSLCIYGYFKAQTYKNVDSYLKEELEYIGIQLERNHLYVAPKLLDPKNIVYIYKDNQVKYFTPNGYFKDFIPYNNSKDLGFSTYKEDGYTFRELKFNVAGYTIQIIRNIDSEMVLLNRLLAVFFVGVIFAIIITYFIALYLTKKALVPIERTWNNQVKFIQDASHELRTPITIISSKLESILKHPQNSISDEVETIADAMKENRRLKKMVNDLLHLTKEESITNLQIEEFDINDLIKDISNDYIEIADMYDKEFSYDFYESNSIIITDKAKLRQLILIFIDNAFKYTNEGDYINISVSDRDNNFIISIKDSGIGIKDYEVNLIFDRFFRSENVRDKDIDGSGIGLSIAKMIVNSLKGNIKVYSKINKGTTFDIALPKKIKNN
ncbi:sensor histidine kinase [Paraclostridium tenue]|uniref:histidine kinase n=1 Tax=Paeniclostridium hominis TaxID=2764329 RepID=A0ABR7K6D6_9FIRM|nr:MULTISPECIES: HAMP domain-containing sensor histidine kinase [Paeniclostridium]MBC6004659.1 HAMP domain-containing histidine kinase [Paeniclostridium hominis]